MKIVYSLVSGGGWVRKILVVEDELMLRVLLGSVLRQKFECEVVCAAGGNEAFQLAQNEPFDIVISDYAMPEGTGLDLLWALRTAKIDTPLIFYTGSSPESLVPHFSPPVRAIVAKPEIKILLSCVRESLLQTDPLVCSL
ncbi:MAG: response regulator [Oligoflexia bacterium]|nr:response regulator [Oligoflexia bacterium]